LLLVVFTLQLISCAGTLIAVRMQYRRKQCAAAAAGEPVPPPRPLLYLGLWMVWLLSAILDFGVVYFVSLS
jgi:hypothetical protein